MAEEIDYVTSENTQETNKSIILNILDLAYLRNICGFADILISCKIKRAMSTDKGIKNFQCTRQ